MAGEWPPPSLLAGATFLLSQCRSVDSIQALPDRAVFVVEVGRFERFKIELRDGDRITEAADLLRNGRRACVAGALASGDGGFNAPYHWHLVPASIRWMRDRQGPLDALPSEVEEDVEHWLHDLKRYSPWESRIVAREK